MLPPAPRASNLLVPPLGNPPRSPWRAGGFHLLLQLLQIHFDQLTQLSEHTFEFSRSVRVLIHLRLRWTCCRHPLRADDRPDAFIDRWWQVEVALTQSLIAAQCSEDFILPLLKRG